MVQSQPQANQGPGSGSLAQDTFVGRQLEMGELRAALGDAISGQGRIVMLVGEPGIGKTRITQEMASYAETLGTTVLWGACYEGEGAPPYWPWIQALRSYVETREDEQLLQEMGAGAAQIAEVVGKIGERFPHLVQPPALPPEQARFRLLDSIATFLKNAAQSQPLVIVLDDLHWAEKSSLLLLEFMAHEQSQSRLLLVGTYRDMTLPLQHPLSQTLGNLVREPSFQRVELKGLTPQEVERFMEVTGLVSTSSQLVQSIYERTDGNPLFLTELVRLFRHSGLPEEQNLNGLVPVGVRDAIRRRIGHLSDLCNRAMTTASVVGREFDCRLLEVLIEEPECQLLEAVEEALAVQLIEEHSQIFGRYKFAHALIQEALATELSQARLARLHAGIAEALEQLCGIHAEEHASELAYHYSEAQSLLGPAKLLRYSQLAGQQALAVYAYEEALEHFQRAVAAKEGQPMDGETAHLLFGLGCAQVATYQYRVGFNNFSSAFDYYDKVGDIDKVVAVVEYLTNLPVWDPEEAQLVERALQLVPPDSHQAAVLMSTQGAYIFVGAADSDAIMDAVDRALAIARREQDVSLEMKILSNAAVILHMACGWQSSVETGFLAIELTQRVRDPISEAQTHHSVIRSLICLGDLEHSKLQSAGMMSVMEKLGGRVWLPIGLATRALLFRVEGNWVAARADSDRGIALVEQCWDQMLIRVLLEYESGNFGRGRTYLERMAEIMLADSTEQIHERLLAALALALVAHITGLPDRLDAAQSVAQTVVASPSMIPLLYIVVAQITLALSAVQERNNTMAASQYDALQTIKNQYIYISGDRLLGLLAHTLGKVAKAKSHFEAALNFCRTGGYRPELAWSCCEYAEVLLQCNCPEDHTKAIYLLEESLGLSREMGIEPLIDRVIAFQQQVQSQRSMATYPDGLTQREVEVLRLIALGKSNRQIAEGLLISLNTVERHVSNILAKTGTANRADAAGYALRSNLAS